MRSNGYSSTPWADYDDKAMLRLRICDLKVGIHDSCIKERIDRLYSELEAGSISFRPPCYLSTEWLCPDRVPAIGIPFYLAHPRLIKLEKTMMLEAEGDSEEEFMKLLRHETGHAINYAYRLYRRSRWRELFGPISRDYDPHNYSHRPYSRKYVVHLRDNYAQAHPDEDFAETFAVWLTPGSNWRERYTRSPAVLRKLKYVDHLMNEIGQKTPVVTLGRGHWYWAASRTRATLDTYFKNKRREYASAFAGYYDPVLRRLFTDQPSEKSEKASRFLGRYRKRIVNEVSSWMRIPKYSADDLVRRLAQRSRDLDLYVRAGEEDSMFSVGVCITALVMEARDLYVKDLYEEGVGE